MKKTTQLSAKCTQIFILFAGIILMFSRNFSAENPTFLFLRTDVSARAASLGGGFSTVHDDINAMFYNPATLGTLSSSQASFGYYSLLMDVSAGSAAYGQTIEDFGIVGAGIRFVNYGDFIQTDNNGVGIDQFSALDIAFNIGASYKFEERLFFGGNMRIISSSIANYSSSGIAFDFGTLYTLENNRTSFAFTVNNLGTQLSSYIDTKEPLPMDIKLAISHRPERLPVTLNLSFNRLNDAKDGFSSRLSAFSFGGEFKIGNYLRARLGYNNQRRQDLKIGSGIGLAGFSMGFGVVYEEFTFDYTSSLYGSVGSLSFITVGMKL
ncbi:MAG: type IX secretion system protein PorQ [Bacteroidota bacterium]